MNQEPHIERQETEAMIAELDAMLKEREALIKQRTALEQQLFGSLNEQMNKHLEASGTES